MDKHVSVLLKESIQYLNVKEKGIYVDCTLGRGGHTSEILKILKNTGMVYGIDQDPTAIEHNKKVFKDLNNFKVLEGNFLNITGLLALENVFKVDGILYDLGVSSPQFDIPERGFSYRYDGPLDMRMDTINNPLTAAIIVNTYEEILIEKILRSYGDEPFANKIASAIVKARPINTTLELVNVIKQVLPQKVLKQKKHPAKKTFQALRIAVNNEIEILKNSLEQSLKLLNSKGRICVITFHSLEERIVKEVFKEATISEDDYLVSKLPVNVESKKEFQLVIKKPLKASSEELEQNNRAHSSKLFVIEKK